MIGYWHHPVVCLSVLCTSDSLSVCDAVHCGPQGWCTGLKALQRVPRRHVPICPFRHFCCRMHRLASKRTTKNESKKHICVLVYIDYLLWPNFVVMLRAWVIGFSECVQKRKSKSEIRFFRSSHSRACHLFGSDGSSPTSSKTPKHDNTCISEPLYMHFYFAKQAAKNNNSQKQNNRITYGEYYTTYKCTNAPTWRCTCASKRHVECLTKNLFP